MAPYFQLFVLQRLEDRLHSRFGGGPHLYQCHSRIDPHMPVGIAEQLCQCCAGVFRRTASFSQTSGGPAAFPTANLSQSCNGLAAHPRIAVPQGIDRRLHSTLGCRETTSRG